MKALIVEDERLAADSLIKILEKTGGLELIGVLESIYEVVEWFKKNEEPEIMFLDIHLADGSAFEIFEKIEVNCPVIFTTAYDEYALKAFKVNSIDYLLKPLDISAVKKSLVKLKKLTIQPAKLNEDIRNIMNFLRTKNSYSNSFLVPAKGDKLIPLKVDEILYFFIENGIVKAVTNDKNSIVLDKTLDELYSLLDPSIFYRANRQFIVSRKSIKDIDLWFNQRLSVNLIVPTHEKIIISKARIRDFKKWFSE